MFLSLEQFGFWYSKHL